MQQSEVGNLALPTRPPRTRQSIHRRQSIHNWLSLHSTQTQSEATFKGTGERAMEVPFRLEWEEQHRRGAFDPTNFRVGCFVIACIISTDLVLILVEGQDGLQGGELWFHLTWAPLLLCDLEYLVVSILFSRLNPHFGMRLYNVVAAGSLILLYSAVLAKNAIQETRLVRFGYDEPDVMNNSIYDQPRSDRCNITSYTSQHTYIYHHHHGLTFSCINEVLEGSSFSILILCSLLPVLYGLSMVPALVVTIVDSSLLAAVAIGFGERNWVPLIMSWALQLAVGLFSVGFCRSQCQTKRRQFAITMATTQAAQQNSDLLYRIIPRNVVQTMQKQRGEGSGCMLGESMRHCTVMFCSLQPQHELQKGFSIGTFHFLNDTFSAFDAAVERSVPLN